MNCAKKITVKMGDVVKEMGDHVPESFLGHHIFLAAVLAISALYNRSAVQTVFLFSLRYMRHRNFFLKISTKTYKNPFFFVTEQLR